MGSDYSDGLSLDINTYYIHYVTSHSSSRAGDRGRPRPRERLSRTPSVTGWSAKRGSLQPESCYGPRKKFTPAVINDSLAGVYYLEFSYFATLCEGFSRLDFSPQKESTREEKRQAKTTLGRRPQSLQP